MREDTEENRREVTACLDAVCGMVQPVGLGLFAGVMDYSSLPLLLRLMVKTMGAPEGDSRDWEGIRAWTGRVRDQLTEWAGRSPGRDDSDIAPPRDHRPLVRRRGCTK